MTFSVGTPSVNFFYSNRAAFDSIFSAKPKKILILKIKKIQIVNLRCSSMLTKITPSLGEQFLHELETWIHHAAPLVVAAGVLALLADGLSDPLLELRLRQVVVVDPALVAGVVRRIDVDALDAAGVGREQSLQREQVVALDDQVAVEPGPLALLQNGQLAVELQRVMRDGVVVVLDGGLALELQDRHVSHPWEFEKKNWCRLGHRQGHVKPRYPHTSLQNKAWQISMRLSRSLFTLQD